MNSAELARWAIPRNGAANIQAQPGASGSNTTSDSQAHLQTSLQVHHAGGHLQHGVVGGEIQRAHNPSMVHSALSTAQPDPHYDQQAARHYGSQPQQRSGQIRRQQCPQQCNADAGASKSDSGTKRPDWRLKATAPVFQPGTPTARPAAPETSQPLQCVICCEAAEVNLPQTSCQTCTLLVQLTLSSLCDNRACVYGCLNESSYHHAGALGRDLRCQVAATPIQ